jgi:5'-nucleotidase
MLGVPAFAVSIAQKKTPPYEWALPHIQYLGNWILKNGLPPGVALNMNVPAIPPEKVLGYRVTKQGLSCFKENFERREDPRGNHYYWLSGQATAFDREESSDVVAVASGYVSITPLFYDLTAHNQMEDLACSLNKP